MPMLREALLLIGTSKVFEQARLLRTSVRFRTDNARQRVGCTYFVNQFCVLQVVPQDHTTFTPPPPRHVEQRPHLCTGR